MNEPGAPKEPTHEKVGREEILACPPHELKALLLSKENDTAFWEQAVADPALCAHLSYWEKYLGPLEQRAFEHAVKTKIEKEPFMLPGGLERFNETDQKLILEQTRAIQLTFGCSHGCPLCGVDAPGKKRESIPFAVLDGFFQKYGSILSHGRPFLYWASDPFDYRDGEKTYPDISELAKKYASYAPAITANKPDEQALMFMATEARENIDQSVRVSARDGDDRSDALAGREMDLADSGVSVLNSPFGKGIGTSFSPESIGEAGIGCFDGILVTPRGIYNIVQNPITKELPEGQFVVPLETISDTAPQIGDSFRELLRRHIVFADNFTTTESWEAMVLKPYITLISHAGAFDITLSEQGQVQNCIPSRAKEISEWLEARRDVEMGMMYIMGFKKMYREGKLEAVTKDVWPKFLPDGLKRIYTSFLAQDSSRTDNLIENYLDFGRYIITERTRLVLKKSQIMNEQKEKIGPHTQDTAVRDARNVVSSVGEEFAKKMMFEKREIDGITTFVYRYKRDGYAKNLYEISIPFSKEVAELFREAETKTFAEIIPVLPENTPITFSRLSIAEEIDY